MKRINKFKITSFLLVVTFIFGVIPTRVVLADDVVNDKNIAEYTFFVDGEVKTKDIEIDSNLIGYTPTYPYSDDEITVTYEIDPKEFIKENNGDIKINNARLLFDLGSNFMAAEGQGLVSNENGKFTLDLSDKIKYTYDSESNKYKANKFTVSFKVMANTSGDNLSFASVEIEYANILAENNPIIVKSIDIPSITVRDVGQIPEYNEPDIRILEIEPADSFKLTNLSTRATTGIENITKTIQDKTYTIEITHMTMSEFIGKVDDINGKYNIVVIGKYVDNTLNGPNGKLNIYNDAYNSIWFANYMELENDITNKKVREIKNFINSGQLVFIDSDIKSMKYSKLWWHTTNSQGDLNQIVDNLVKNMSVNSGNNNEKINIDNVINKYIQRINENNELVKHKVVSTLPIGDSNDDDLGKVYNRNMRFDISGSSLVNKNVTINLYLDINGDGLFKNEEIVKTVNNVNIPEEGYKLEYNLYNDYPQFIGYLEWRIEVVKDTVSNYTEPIKAYFDGNILFRRVTEEKRLINVLQISPFDRENLEATSSEGKGGNLNLKTNIAFQNMLKQKEVQDYEINIEVISYEDFYSGNYLGPGRESLNGSKYHMIIMGFSDTFREKQISSEGIKQIESFIETGQGLMLTHDTIWYKSWDEGQKNIRNASEFIKVFRDVTGQARYVDPNNESQIGLNGQNIVHDPNRPEVDSYGSGYPKEAGATLLELNDVNNSNSTEVYRVNESLITNYPFELGETIRVRRTHGQYLQLNFEEDDVVPLFNLAENNSNNTGNNEKIDKNHSKNKVNRYDSRNSYYTYSKGNITFSGTGENTRESVEYPDSELKLFVNTIVKAERGANHKPEISALENIYEIPYNSDLQFDAIVKDVDGDKVKVNKITIDGEEVDEYRVPTSLVPQGSKFPVLISSEKFQNKVGRDVKIYIEAEDSKGAITLKEYIIRPVIDALLTSRGETINTLVGEKVDFKIKLNKENDSNPTSIAVNGIEVPNKDGVVTLTDIKTEDIDGELYLSGSLISLVESSGEEIPIIINYNNGTSTSKRCETKIIVNSKFGEVTIKVMGINGENLGVSPIVVLRNSNGTEVTGKISESDGQVKFNSVKAGDYEVSVTEIEGYNITSTEPNGKVTLSYSESSKTVVVKLSAKVSELKHGLYGGINDTTVIIDEKPEGFEMVSGVNINFGSTFILSGNSYDVKLKIDTGLINSGNKNDIKVYKVVDKDGKSTLSRIEGNKVNITLSSNEYSIKINDNIENNTRILITYTGIIPKNKLDKTYSNQININANSKDVNVYTNYKDRPVSLPDLF